MLKTVMFASAVAISAPALAQDMTPQAQTPAPTTQAAPATATTPVAADPAAPATTAQVTPADPAAAPAQTASAAPAAPAPAPISGAEQIAQVVSTEFPSYDKNKDGNLDKVEFASWMVALKTASDPSTKAADPATKKWTDGAFVSADVDKSKVVSQAELTKYLSIGAE